MEGKHGIESHARSDDRDGGDSSSRRPRGSHSLFRCITLRSRRHGLRGFRPLSWSLYFDRRVIAPYDRSSRDTFWRVNAEWVGDSRRFHPADHSGLLCGLPPYHRRSSGAARAIGTERVAQPELCAHERQRGTSFCNLFPIFRAFLWFFPPARRAISIRYGAVREESWNVENLSGAEPVL